MKIEFIINGETINVSDKGYVLDTDTFDLGTPKPKLTYLEIEGADGKVNITHALTKDIKYDNRDVNFDFRKISKSIDDYSNHKQEYEGVFVGQDMKVVINDQYYLIGSFECEYSRSNMTTTLNIKGDCNAWKYELNEYTKHYELSNSSKEITLENLTKFVEPKFIVDGELEITLGDTKYILTSGISYPFILESGNTTMTFKGTCTVDISYERGFK